MLIDSMPPATATSMSPVAMPWAASITAFSPEPQTLLMVSAATRSCRPPLSAAWRAGILAVARLDDVAHDALVHDRGIDAGARDRLAHDMRAELGGLEIFQRAEKFAGRGSCGGDDDALVQITYKVPKCQGAKVPGCNGARVQSDVAVARST